MVLQHFNTSTTIEVSTTSLLTVASLPGLLGLSYSNFALLRYSSSIKNSCIVINCGW